MKILILSCNTGQGHNSAASALKEAIDRRGDTCEIHNALLFLSQTADEIISDGHVFVYRKLPRLFGMGYRYEERHQPRFICSQMKKGVSKFREFWESHDFDAIICTHVFGCLLVNEYKKETGATVINSLVATDYTCCPCSLETEADIYFTPHPQLEHEFIKSGIAKDRLCHSGIPVRNTFLSSVSKENARRELSLPQDKKIVLVGCGSMGCGPMAKLSEELAEAIGDDGLVITACGSNKRLLGKLKKLNMENLLPLSFTSRMSLYMDAADLYLTKAGGLSTTEAIIKMIPLVYINAVPGCETRNIDFMVQHNYALAAFSPEGAVSLTLSALNNLERSRQMIADCNSQLPHDPAAHICSYISDYINRTK